MKFDVLTLFPEMFEPIKQSIIGKAEEKKLIDINLINIFILYHVLNMLKGLFFQLDGIFMVCLKYTFNLIKYTRNQLKFNKILKYLPSYNLKYYIKHNLYH